MNLTPEQHQKLQEALKQSSPIVVGEPVEVVMPPFWDIYAELCGVAFRHFMETGSPVCYADIAQMARYMTEAGLKEVGDGQGE